MEWKSSGRLLRAGKLTPRGVEAFARAAAVAVLVIALAGSTWEAVRRVGADGPPSREHDPRGMLDLPVHPSNRYTAPPVPPPPRPPVAPPRPTPTPAPPPVATDAPLPPPPPVTVYGLTLDPARDQVVLVLDISSSMSWDQQAYTTVDGGTATGPRIDRAKVQLIRCLRAMAGQAPAVKWRVNVLAYDCDVRWAMREATNPKVPLLPVKENLEALEGWVGKLAPGGGTGTGGAVYEAAWYVPKECHQLVLITDGAPCCGEAEAPGDPTTLRRHLSIVGDAQQLRGPDRFRIDVVGVGATGVFRQFCLDVAARGAGTFIEVK